MREVCFGSFNAPVAALLFCVSYFCSAAKFSKSSTWGKGTHSYFMSFRSCIYMLKCCAELQVHASSICLKPMLQSKYPMCVCCLSNLVQSSPKTTIEIQVREGYPVSSSNQIQVYSLAVSCAFQKSTGQDGYCHGQMNLEPNSSLKGVSSLSNFMWFEPSKNWAKPMTGTCFQS